MKYKGIILLVFTVLSCSKMHYSNLEKKAISETVKDTLNLNSECVKMDSVTPLGTTIHHKKINDKFQVSYKNETFNRTYDSLYTCYYEKDSGLWDFVPKLDTETKNNLVFKNILYTSSGANPMPLEFYCIVMPKNNQDSIFEKEFYIKSIGDYLVYGDGKDNNIIHIRNIETKKEQNIILSKKSYLTRTPTLFIEDVNILKNRFRIKYESMSKNEEIHIVKESFKLLI